METITAIREVILDFFDWIRRKKYKNVFSLVLSFIVASVLFLFPFFIGILIFAKNPFVGFVLWVMNIPWGYFVFKVAVKLEETKNGI